MEEFNDLTLLIAEAQRMANTFKAFERLPRVLQVIQAAKNMPKEMDRLLAVKKAELKDLEKLVETSQNNLSQLTSEVENADKKFNALTDEVNAEKRRLKALMQDELKEARNEANRQLAVINANMDVEIAEHNRMVETSAQKTDKAIELHKTNIGRYQREEAEAKKRADKAAAHLENLKQSLFKGE